MTYEFDFDCLTCYWCACGWVLLFACVVLPCLLDLLGCLCCLDYTLFAINCGLYCDYVFAFRFGVICCFVTVDLELWCDLLLLLAMTI